MAEKGKIKVINNGSGGIITDPRGTMEYTFTQPNHKLLCLNKGDKVKFDLVEVPGVATTAINVERITAGTILTVDGKGNGMLEERQTQKSVAFWQPYAKESGLKPGDVVRYSLICTERGELAVNLAETAASADD